eukprot:5861539-Prymnesium_polylepis.1
MSALYTMCANYSRNEPATISIPAALYAIVAFSVSGRVRALGFWRVQLRRSSISQTLVQRGSCPPSL